MKNASNFAICLLIAGSATLSRCQEGDLSDLFSRSACEFSAELLKATSKENENTVVSPASVSMVLSLLQQGARGNTATELDELLGVRAETTRSGYANVTQGFKSNYDNVAVEWGNRAYIKPGFTVHESFKSNIAESFEAEVEELDFASDTPKVIADSINQWAGKCTHNHVTEVVQPDMVRADTIMLLVNIIYLRGKWLHRFRAKHTKTDAFETRPGETVTATYLCQKNKFFAGMNATLGIKWVELPFEGDKYRMIVALPTKRHNLGDVMEKMTGEDVINMISYGDESEIRLKLPKFKIKGTYALVDILKRLGLRDIFTEASNLQGMSPEPVHVSDAVHQANIEIDETGGTAFASTILTLSRKLVLTDTFTVDQPFLFFVVDVDHRIPLFAGRIVDPTTGG